MRSVDAICFDLFDTLIRFQTSNYRQYQSQLAERLKIQPRNLTDAYKSTLKGAFNGEIVTLEVQIERVLALIGREKDELPEALVEERRALKNCTQIIPGVEEFLLYCQSKGLLLGIISNASAAGEEILELSGLGRFMEEQIFSYVEQLSKPDPRVYLLACDRLKIPPERTIYISDGNRGELFGAAQAGLIPVRFDPTSQYQHLPVPPGIPEFKVMSNLQEWLQKQL